MNVDEEVGFLIDGYKLEKEKCFKYLGTQVTKNCKLLQMKKSMHYPANVVWKQDLDPIPSSYQAPENSPAKALKIHSYISWDPYITNDEILDCS